MKAFETKRMLAAEPKDDAQVYVTRAPANDHLFAWEIRRFGGVVLDRSSIGFISAAEAKCAGDAAWSHRQVVDPTDVASG